MSSRTELANAIRALSMDAVQKAKSGHPGAPMGMADIAEVLWNDYMVHNPTDPAWADRDRFVLSNGHGSMLIYSLLHLTGYDLPIEELKNFRQLHSKTPGHPEYGYAPGVETTTGPLGQGIANAVGMALAEKVLAAQFNREGHEIVDHNTYVFLGDGCLMEGISHEACSLAGTLGLGKLVVFYDDNGISIDGEVEGWFTDDTPKRFESYGWHVVPGVDGHDANAIKAAIEDARAESEKPTLICCKTVIGFGSPNKQGKEDCHGAPLGDEEIALVRKTLNWEHAPFEIPQDVYDRWCAKKSGAKAQSQWQEKFDAYKAAYPELAAEFERRVVKGDLPADFSEKATAYIKQCQENPQKIASRKASQNAINAYGELLPELIGGSADLAGSNLTKWSGSKGVDAKDASGNYIFYGVREFGMSAMMNGIALHGGFVNYGATFLMFMEYARNAVRMAALMKQQSIFVYTHDSIGLGEDGPTHQPVEQLSSLRSTPNLNTWRPCDEVESAVAWKSAVERRDGPSALVFSRQGLEPQPRSDEQLAAVERGGYVLVDVENPQAVLIATGSEVGLVIESAKQLAEEGVAVRVVSMPCPEVFEKQDAAYKESVLPAALLARVAVEALHKDFWYKYVGLDGRIVGMESFGESAPGGALMEHFGFTVDNVVSTVKDVLAG
ncbi:transketolase [Sessilibacter corallicola]|uniref:transketolase n=1 Tax=Sessilibacter corallicola TaxID=2904075 RepID=UPI001E57BEB9|nr:transketolase [Sessilibacter corallicola]MCE2027702.1 transketolase [Sessilibacter corallicola]